MDTRVFTGQITFHGCLSRQLFLLFISVILVATSLVFHMRIIHGRGIVDPTDEASVITGPDVVEESTASKEDGNRSSSAIVVLEDSTFPKSDDSETSSGYEWSKDEATWLERRFCLQNIRLAFVGDSLTRYQYISLAHYLHKGRWVKDTDKPNPVDEHDFTGGWKGFYEFNIKAFEGKENCDCYHPEGASQPKRTFENCYYADEENNVYLSYHQKYGHHESKGHWEPARVNQYRTFEHEYAPELWKYNWTGVIQNHIARLHPKPRYLIVNTGIWKHDLNREVFQNIKQTLNSMGILGIYKTTTKKNNETTPELCQHDAVGCETFEHCLDLSLTSNITGRDNYVDRFHFRAHIYQQINEQLLQLLMEIDTNAT